MRPSVRIIEPEEATYGGDSIRLTLATSNFMLPGDGVVCVEVSWAQGSKSFCKDKLDSWVMRGLEDGNYLNLAQLRDGDQITSRVVAETRQLFDIVIPTAARLPRLVFTFPTGE